jgi:tetratricopeptide (TPR) repeat protein
MELVTGEQYGETFLPPSGNLEALMKVMKAVEYISRTNKEGNILARQEIQEAIALDPDYSIPYSLLGFIHLLDLPVQSSESPLGSLTQASKNIRKAIALDDENWLAHSVLSQLYLYRKDHDNAIAAAERAIALNPSGARSYSQLGWLLTLSGRAEEGITLMEKSVRLDPIASDQHLNRLGYAYRVLGRYEDAIEAHKRALRRSPNNLFFHMWLAAAYSASGRKEEASHHAEEVLRIDPTFSLDRYADIHAMKDEAEAERFFADLRKAGLK